MGEDISRSTFNPAKRYNAVRQQQGRVQLDADWNEQVDIAAYRINTEACDVIGTSGVPRDAAGFGISAAIPNANSAPTDLAISSGRIYVSGQMCEIPRTPVGILNFTGDGTAAAGTQVQLASVVLDGAPLQPGQWLVLTAQGSPAPSPALAQVTAVNAKTGSVTFNVPVTSFGSPNTNPQAQRYITYLTQPDYPSPPALSTSGNAIVYLDVWERPVDFVDDPSLQEIALGGADTTTRTRTIWQVKYVSLAPTTPAACSTPDANINEWIAVTQPSAGLFTNGVLPVTNAGPCSISAGGGYSGIENQLYRVQIHQPGTLAGAAGPFTYPLPKGTATFKWSRDNASVTTAVTGITASASSGGAASSQLTVASTGRDAVLSFKAGDWIEITDDTTDLSGGPGELHQIDINGVDQARSTITLTTPVSTALQGRLTGSHTRIRRWDQGGKVLLAGNGNVWVDLGGAGSTGDIPVPPPGTTLVLENGITVSFALSVATGSMKAGDAWKFAARTATGNIEPLVQAPPSGNQHHYCRLGIVSFDTWNISDCRQTFAPLGERGIHVNAVALTTSGTNLLNDSTLMLQDLAVGIDISCDGALDPVSISQPDNTAGANAVPLTSAQATCQVTVGLPIVSTGPATNVAPIPPYIYGYQQMLMGAAVSLDSTGTTIHWVPTATAVAGLRAQMNTIAATLSPGTQPSSLVLPTLLAHLTLKGDKIWSASDPNTYLDGETLGVPYTDPIDNKTRRTGILLPSGDGRPGGDFSMWFWIQSPPAPPDLAASVTALTFSETVISTTSQPLSITLKNNTAAALPVSITVPPQFATIPPGSIGNIGTVTNVSIPANSTIVISLTFTPTQTGTITGNLTLVGGNTTLAIALSGTSTAYHLSPSSTALNLGSVTVGGKSGSQQITLTNDGSATTAIIVSGAISSSANFLVTFSATTLARGQSTTVNVIFSPQTAGSINGSLIVTTSPINLIPSPIALTGTGVAPKTTKDTKEITVEKVQRDVVKVTDVFQKQGITKLQPQVEPLAEPATGQAFIQANERPAVGPAVPNEVDEQEK